MPTRHESEEGESENMRTREHENTKKRGKETKLKIAIRPLFLRVNSIYTTIIQIPEDRLDSL